MEQINTQPSSNYNNLFDSLCQNETRKEEIFVNKYDQYFGEFQEFDEVTDESAETKIYQDDDVLQICQNCNQKYDDFFDVCQRCNQKQPENFQFCSSNEKLLLGNSSIPELSTNQNSETTSTTQSTSLTNISFETKRPVEKYYEKNMCRHIVKWTITAIMENTGEFPSVYHEKLLELCDNNEILVKDFRKYIAYVKEKQNSFLGGPKSIQKFLLSGKDEPEGRYVKIFQKFIKWFLQKKALVHIIYGSLKDKKRYVNYKNNVLLKLIKHPKQWPFKKSMK